MGSNVVEGTVKNGLCVSCGICAAVCAKKCITFVNRAGQYYPEIDKDTCVNCGVCDDVCSARNIDFGKFYKINAQQHANDIYSGNYVACYNAFAIDERVRKNSASGGCITAIIKELLIQGEYGSAFLVDSFKYDKFVETKRFQKNDLLDQTSKSRYIPVSHKSMVEYALSHKNEKIIVVATGCVMHTFLNVIERYNLNRSKYLLLGLFCDNTMNYNVFEYFKDYGAKRNLDKLYFKTKEQTGWPGNVKLEYPDGDSVFLEASERTMLKEYFQLESCLYCVDKLNQFSDISFGDNYTGMYGKKGDLGSSSIIIRTPLGEKSFNLVKQNFVTFDIHMDDIRQSQKVTVREKNLKYAGILFRKTGINIYSQKAMNANPDKNDIKDYNDKILKLTFGRIYPRDKIKILNGVKKKKAQKKQRRIKTYLKTRIKNIING